MHHTITLTLALIPTLTLTLISTLTLTPSLTSMTTPSTPPHLVVADVAGDGAVPTLHEALDAAGNHGGVDDLAA